MFDSEIIELIRKGKHSEAIDLLYQSFPAFKNSFLKTGGNSSDAIDIFQDALLILLQKLGDSNFTLNCKINTYLFGICRNLSSEYFRRKGREVKIHFEGDEPTYEIENLDIFLEEENKYKALDKTLACLGKKCIDILTLFYLQNLSMGTIALQLGFSSETSAKTQKYKCIEKARDLSKSALLELKSERV